MVCGSIGYGGINEIKNMYTSLLNHGFSIVDHIVHKGMDYSHITDFRDKQDSSQITISFPHRWSQPTAASQIEISKLLELISCYLSILILLLSYAYYTLDL